MRGTFQGPTGELRAKGSSNLDAALIQQCLNGNESAWASLIGKYKNLIFSIPVRDGFSPEDSGDVFQAVCMELLSGLPRLREHDALPAWLVQVTKNKCFRRKQEVERYPSQEVDEFIQRDSKEGPEHLLLQLQHEQRIREAMNELPDRCQRLLRMLFFELPPRPYQEVAKNLGIALGSIGFTRSRCLEKLRRHLEEAGLRAL